MMAPKMLAKLNQQIKEETYSAYTYHAMAADLEHKGYKGMAAWMRVQAREEKIHADIFYNFILERGEKVELWGDREAPVHVGWPLGDIHGSLRA